MSQTIRAEFRAYLKQQIHEVQRTGHQERAEFRAYLKQQINEVQRNGHQERAEFSAEKEFLRLQKSSLLKEMKSKDGYSLYKYHDYLFLSKDDRYIAHLDGTTDKLEGKKSFYITVM